MKNQIRTYLYHIIGCLAFVLLPLMISPRPPEETGAFFNRPTVRDLIANVLMLLFFYVNYYLIIPRIYFRKKYLNYFIVVTISFVLIIILPSLLTGEDFTANTRGPSPASQMMQGGMPRKPQSPFIMEVRHHIYLFCVVILFSILLQVNRRFHQSERDKAEAELANLKARIHPHFLFNTLNSIYALSVTGSEKAPDSIVKLSEFMRYLLKDAKENQVLLSKELDYISNYLDLQSSRLRDSVRINYELSGSPGQSKVAPLLLFAFIENAFKHGVNPEEDSQIDIRISMSESAVELLVRNNKVVINNMENSLGIGVSNSQDRLTRLYPEKHKLAIESMPDYFLVSLSLELT